MKRLRGVGTRLALALLGVVAGVLAIVYLVVVPSYRASLEQTDLSKLGDALRTRAVPAFPPQAYLRQEFAQTFAPILDARVVVYTPIGAGALEPEADSDLDGYSVDVENDPIARRAAARGRLAQGTVTRKGQVYAEAAMPVQGSVVLLQDSLSNQLQVVSVVRRRVFVAGGLALVFASVLGYAGASLFARRIRRLERAADRIAEGDFDEPVVDRAHDEVGQLARSFERMRLQLAHLDRARSAFIANASHELRTPLFSLGGFLELLDEEEIDEATRAAFVAEMRRQVVRLARLATNLLDLSRLDAGRLGVSTEPFPIDEVAAALRAELEPRARRGGHVLVGAPSSGTLARADAERTHQIGRALVENALVHTPAGTTIRVESGADGAGAFLTVADDGPGIPPEARQQVFERFFRLDGSRASGSGLGLAIARELAELMDGRLELADNDGWTTFTLSLPAVST